MYYKTLLIVRYSFTMFYAILKRRLSLVITCYLLLYFLLVFESIASIEESNSISS